MAFRVKGRKSKPDAVESFPNIVIVQPWDAQAESQYLNPSIVVPLFVNNVGIHSPVGEVNNVDSSTYTIVLAEATTCHNNTLDSSPNRALCGAYDFGSPNPIP